MLAGTLGDMAVAYRIIDRHSAEVKLHLSLNGSWIEVSESRLLQNLETFRSVIGADTNLMVVVKSNAYGHGLETVARAIGDRTDWFGVDALEEARVVDEVAPGKPILILGRSKLEHASEIVQRDFRQVIYRRDMAEALSSAAGQQGKRAHIHLKVETGTNRQGIPMAELAEFAQSVARLPHAEIEGVYTHFANIEDTQDTSFAQMQLARFNEALGQLRNVDVEPQQVHGAATAGILLYPEIHFTMVRLGIGAYGVWPSRETQVAARKRGRRVTLQPVITWKTQIAQLKKIDAGEYVGYGLSFQAGRPTALAIIPVGYYEGYDRKLSNAGRALIQGKYVPVVGRVAMNMTMLDVTDVNAELDDEVVLLGCQGDTQITADELADKMGTISYEVLSRINPLLERKLVVD